MSEKAFGWKRLCGGNTIGLEMHWRRKGLCLGVENPWGGKGEEGAECFWGLKAIGSKKAFGVENSLG